MPYYLENFVFVPHTIAIKPVTKQTSYIAPARSEEHLELGWVFIDADAYVYVPGQRVAQPAYLNGRLLFLAYGFDIRIAQQTGASLNELLGPKGYRVTMVYPFAENLYGVQPLSLITLPHLQSVSTQLLELPGCTGVEPHVLEIVGHR